MRKQLNQQEFEGYKPGCIGGILHVLHCHQWHTNFKRLSPPRRKHRSGKRAMCCENPKTVSLDHNINDVIEYQDADSIPSMIEKENLMANETNRTHHEVYTDESISKRMSAGSKLHQIDSIHHLKTSQDFHDAKGIDSTCSVAVPDGDDYVVASRSQVSSVPKEMGENHQITPKGGLLETLKINKNLFLEIVQVTDSETEKQILKGMLKKSGSFPVPASSRGRISSSRTLEHKQNEIWYLPKPEKSSLGTKETILNEPRPSKVPSKKADDDRTATTIHGKHHSFLSQFKDLKKVVKHFLRESKRDDLQINKTQPEGNNSLRQNEHPHPTDSSVNELINGRSTNIRRSTSLNESMDRYTRLIEYSLNGETKWKQYKSKSLKLSSENRLDSKRFRRRFSLTDLDSTTLIEGHDQLKLNNIRTENRRLEVLDAREEIKHDEAVMTSELQINVVEPQKSEYNSNQDDQANNSMINLSNKQDQQDLTNDHLDDMVRRANFSASKGFNPSYEESCINKSESSIEAPAMSNRDPLAEAQECTNNMKSKNANLVVDSNLYGFNSNKNMDDPDFIYLRNVLELSGLLEQDGLTTWYKSDQPLDPEMFEELEVYFHRYTKSSTEDIQPCLDRQLLFDLINEELLSLYKNSLAYFPKQFSFSRSALALPKGSHVVDEIWKRVSWYKASGSDCDRSLDDIAAQDLAKGDGWMSLHMDCEDIAVDMEDWILDEVLDEIVCCFYDA